LADGGGFEHNLAAVLELLQWSSDDVDCIIRMSLDSGQRPGSARVIHAENTHSILMYPRAKRPFPWPTVRHELLHALLKSVIKDSLEEIAVRLPVSFSYREQAFRDNVEEYFVRALNALSMSEYLGIAWLRSQLHREIGNGFLLMERALNYLSLVRIQKRRVTSKVFVEFARTLVINSKEKSSSNLDTPTNNTLP